MKKAMEKSFSRNLNSEYSAVMERAASEAWCFSIEGQQSKF